MKKPENRTINEEQWKTLRRETYNTISMILTGVETFLEKKISVYGKNDPEILLGAGLFIHAIEEYGKLVHLKSLSPVNDKVEIDYRGEREGTFRSHHFKFNLALANLPSSCTTLHQTLLLLSNSDEVLVGITNTDWTTRIRIFNTDIDNNGNVINYPSIDHNNLKNAITEFRKELGKTSP